jgi:DNA-binding response OmpR family regulator
MGTRTGQHVRRALLIDDDPLLGKLVSHHLSGSGIECIHLTSYEEALLFLDRNLGKNAGTAQEAEDDSHAVAPLDVVILDYHLNDGQTGLPLCKLIREVSDLPVVMLTGEKSLQATVRCLEEGADQYMCKPFHAEELVARIQASIRARRSYRDSSASGEPPVLTVNVHQREFVFGGMAVTLTEKESLLADILVQHVGLPVPKDDIFVHVYGRLVTFESRCLDVLVGRLRKKLSFTGNRCRVLSVRNRGYKLVVKSDV